MGLVNLREPDAASRDLPTLSELGVLAAPGWRGEAAIPCPPLRRLYAVCYVLGYVYLTCSVQYRLMFCMRRRKVRAGGCSLQSALLERWVLRAVSVRGSALFL